MKRKKRFVTDFLFATPTLLTGAGTVINLAGDYYRFNISDSDVEADLRAIASDFGVTGEDIRKAIKEIEQEALVSE